MSSMVSRSPSLRNPIERLPLDVDEVREVEDVLET